MSTGPQHTPFVIVQADTLEAILDKLATLEKRLSNAQALETACGFNLWRVYTAKEAAALLGTTRLASIHEIDEAELPRVRRIGSHVGFLGVHLLCYMQRREPVDIGGIIDNFRDRLMQDRPTVKPLSTKGKTRVH